MHDCLVTRTNLPFSFHMPPCVQWADRYCKQRRRGGPACAPSWPPAQKRFMRLSAVMITAKPTPSTLLHDSEHRLVQNSVAMSIGISAPMKMMSGSIATKRCAKRHGAREHVVRMRRSEPGLGGPVERDGQVWARSGRVAPARAT